MPHTLCAQARNSQCPQCPWAQYSGQYQTQSVPSVSMGTVLRTVLSNDSNGSIGGNDGEDYSTVPMDTEGNDCDGSMVSYATVPAWPILNSPPGVDQVPECCPPRDPTTNRKAQRNHETTVFVMSHLVYSIYNTHPHTASLSPHFAVRLRR